MAEKNKKRNPWDLNWESANDNLPGVPTKEMFGSEDTSTLPSSVEDIASRARLGNVDSQRLRLAAQGATLNLADEIEAFARSNWNKLAGGETDYETIRNEIRSKVEAYQRSNPGEALTYELIGSIAPTAAMFLLPGGQTAALTNLGSKAKYGQQVMSNIMATGEAARESSRLGNVLKGIMPAAKIGAIEGGIGAYGAGKEGALEDVKNVPLMGLYGGVTSGVAQPAFKAVGGLANIFYDSVSSIFGTKGRDIASRKIREISKNINEDPEVVIQKVLNGELMAEDPAMNAIVKALMSEGGQSGRILRANLDVTSGAKSRRVLQTERDAQERLQEALAPTQQIDDNLVKFFNSSDADARLLERKAYGSVFDVPTNLSPELFADFMNLLKGNRSIQKLVEDIYQSDPSMKRFFVIDAKTGKMKIDSKGRVVLKGNPTLEDAEFVKRGLDEEIKKYFEQGGKNTVIATNWKNRLDPFVNKLDNFSPELATVRADAALLRESREAYNRAKSDLGKQDQESVNYYIDKIVEIANDPQGSTDQLNAYRLGLMTAIKNKFIGNEDIATKLVTPGSKEYQILQKVLPENKINEVMNSLQVSSQSRKAITKMSGGSDTQEKLAAQSILGRQLPGQAISQVIRSGGQDWGAVLPAIIGMFSTGLSEDQKIRISRVLLADKNNINLVREALVDDSAARKLQNLINATVRTAYGGARRQFVANPKETTEGLLSSLTTMP